MKQTKWTWESIRANKHKLSDIELDKAIDSMFPKDIEKITDKLDKGLELSPSEQSRLDQWESSPESGVAGSLMGGMRE